MTTPMTDLRLRLRRAGYSPLPLIGKIPVFNEWQKKIETTEHEIINWETTCPACTNTGGLTRIMPAIDIDITMEPAAVAIEELARDHFEERGYFLTRIGKPPKRAIILKTDTPFKKILRNLTAPDGAPEKIEILGDGQQLVLAGTHPETRREYRWHGGEPGNVPLADLPYIDAATANRFADEAAALLIAEHGYTAPSANGDGQEDDGQPSHDWKELIDHIARGEALHDSLTALAAKLIASGMSGGAVVKTLRAMMDASPAPHDARWQERRDEIPRLVRSAQDKFNPANSADPADPAAAPFVWCDPAAIPRRRWLYGHHYVRRFVTCTVGASGHGKTSLAIAEALALASGRPLLGVTPAERVRVWLWNGEDPREELVRRVEAAMLHYQVRPEEIAGWLFCNGRESRIVIAEQTRAGTMIARPLIERVVENIKANGIGAIVVDPFVKSHRVNENDNSAIDAVVVEWNTIADATNSAIDLLHHVRKGGAGRNGDITIEDTRGASALISASRSARTLNRMSREEAQNLGINEETAWSYFRIDNGKASMAPPPDKADWYRLVPVDLGNGDSVGVATCWTRPGPFDGVTTADLRAAQQAVAAGGPWRADPRADAWVGIPIAEALRLDISRPAVRQRVKVLLATWIKNGMFVVAIGRDDSRRSRPFVRVGAWGD
jgi:hypothetical protein